MPPCPVRIGLKNQVQHHSFRVSNSLLGGRVWFGLSYTDIIFYANQPSSLGEIHMPGQRRTTFAIASLFALSGLIVTAEGAYAQTDKGVKGQYAPPEIEGMRHIRVGDDEKDNSRRRNQGESGQAPAHNQTEDSKPADDARKNKDKEKEKNQRNDQPSETKPKSHFKPKQDWQRLDVIPRLVSGNTDRVNRALADVAATPHKVTPYGLMLAVRGHLEHEQMRQAVLYYYAAQLRTRFDGVRFPANNPSALKHDRMFSQLAGQLSTPVYDWVFAEPERFETMMKRLRKWEHDTAYAYKPLYPTPKIRPRKEWPKLHKKALDQTLAQMKKRAEAYRRQQQ